MDGQIGKVIRSYELEGLIGTGGFGAVYRARQASVAREVAIKIIWPAFANQPNFIRRFEAEAQLVAALEHPHIVPVYDYWRDPDGAYIVMRYLRGGHLRALGKGRDLPVREVAHILEQICAALALAHRYGVVHRDIKPENILLDEQRNAYLADFGIAQIISAARSDDEFSSMGSPAYAAPEILLGQAISTQSDIYSLGVVLFELLTGEYPFPDVEELSYTQLLRLRTTDPLPPLYSRRPELPRALTDVLERATALHPEDRFPDALSLHYVFREALGQPAASYNNGTGRAPLPEVIPNPYRGLRAFEERDANLFYGRESLVRRLITRLMEHDPYARFLAVVGPSGSGKSSVVQAGLVPALRQGALPGSQQWFYSEFVPGAVPMQELANLITSLATTPPEQLIERLASDECAFGDMLHAVLPDDGSDVFLLIDQFEEVFTLSQDTQTAERFIHALFYALTMPNSRLRLVVTIRADFYDRPLLTPRIAELVRERTEVVVPLSLNELERVIVEPARRLGVEFDPALVATIIAEVQEQPGALPLLQYALTELFDHREGSRITQKAYRAVGGVRGALARRADEIYNQLDAEHQEAMRQLFLRLITLGEGTEDTRRRALLSELMNVAGQSSTERPMAMEAVITMLGRARLITFDRDPITRSPTLEVTHEAIIREWSRLRAWLEHSREDVRLQRNLSSMAHDWDSSGQDNSFLLRGVRLQQYERWLQSSAIQLTRQERAYLDTSTAVRTRQEAEEQARREREKQLERRTLNLLRFIIAGLIVIAVGAFGLSAFAFNESRRAEAAARLADENATISRSIALASNAQARLANHNGDLALLLALEANRVSNPPPEARGTLAQVALARGTARLLLDGEAAITGTAMSGDGRFIAAGSTDAIVRVWDAQTGQIVYRLTEHGGDVSSVVFSPDSRLLASSAGDFTVILWDMTSGTLLHQLRGHDGVVGQVIFTPDGQQVLTASNDGRVLLWDVATGEQRGHFEAHQASVVGLAITPDGQRVLSASRDGAVFLWERATGRILGDLSAPGTVNDLDISADGQMALIVRSESGMALWNLVDQTFLRSFVGSTQVARAAAFSTDGQFVISGTLAGEVQIWSTGTGLLIDRLLGHEAEVLSVAVSANGRVAVTGARDTTVRVWNIGTPGLLHAAALHAGRITRIVTGSSGTLYSVGVDGVLTIQPAAAALRRHTFTNLPLLTVAVDPTEQHALVGGRDGMLNLVRLRDGLIERSLAGHTGNVISVVFLSDGQRAVSSSQNGEIILWDVAQGVEIRRMQTGLPEIIYSLRPFNDDTQLAAAIGDNTVRIYDLMTGQEVRTLTGHTGSVYSVDVSVDNRTLVSGARDGFVIVWDAASGAERARLNEDRSAVWAVAFDRTGQRFALGTANGTLSIYDTLTGDQLQTYSFANTVFTLTFALDGRTLHSGHNNGQRADWIVFHDAEAVAWAQQHRYIRTFTCFERELYRVPPLCE